MRIGIFGGTFDPPHMSHVLACHYVLETTNIGRIFVIPCFAHPFGKKGTAYPHRLAMANLAMHRLGEAVAVLDIEGRRAGTSFTIDTVRELKTLYPDDDFVLIVGSDILHEIDRWKDVEALKKLAEIHVIPRLMDASRPQLANPEHFFLPDISSTKVREKLRSGRPVNEYLPAGVIQYIEQNNLYGE